MSTGTTCVLFHSERDRIDWADLSPDAKWLAFAPIVGKRLTVWNLANNKRHLEINSDSPPQPYLTKAGRELIGIPFLSTSNRLFRWNVETKRLLTKDFAVPVRHTLQSPKPAVSAQADRVAVYHNGTVKVLSLTTQSELASFAYRGLRGLALSSDGELLAIGTSTGEVLIHSLKDRTLPVSRFLFLDHKTSIGSSATMTLAFSADNRHLAVAMQCQTWDLEHRTCVRVVGLERNTLAHKTCDSRMLPAIAFAPKETQLAILLADELTVWDWTQDEIHVDSSLFRWQM